MNFSSRIYWNNHSYGRAFRIKAGVLRALFVVACIVTPATNWLLPFVNRIKNDFVMRFE